jgi:uncharacterized membrane protein
MSMALLCRNMIVAVPVAALLTARRFSLSTEYPRLLRALVAVTIGVLFVLFVKGFLIYWTAAVWQTLRAALLVGSTVA